MRIRSIVYEDFTNYKVPSLFIGVGTCDWKCCKEGGLDISVCQNSELGESKPVEMIDERILSLYQYHPIAKAIVIGGLEPFTIFEEILEFVECIRSREDCDIVIYTGYYPDEIADQISKLKKFSNIVVKFGRYIPDQEPHFDQVLGVELTSSNQYAERIS